QHVATIAGRGDVTLTCRRDPGCPGSAPDSHMDPLSFALGIVIGAAATLLGWLWSRQRTASYVGRLEAERDAAVDALQAQRELLRTTQTDTRETFAALSREALRDNRAEFLHTAGAMFAPVRETLDKVQAQLADVDKAREGTFQSVTAQLRA